MKEREDNLLCAVFYIFCQTAGRKYLCHGTPLTLHPWLNVLLKLLRVFAKSACMATAERSAARQLEAALLLPWCFRCNKHIEVVDARISHCRVGRQLPCIVTMGKAEAQHRNTWMSLRS